MKQHPAILSSAMLAYNSQEWEQLEWIYRSAPQLGKHLQRGEAAEAERLLMQLRSFKSDRQSSSR
jgi:hypothetical protein